MPKTIRRQTGFSKKSVYWNILFFRATFLDVHFFQLTCCLQSIEKIILRNHDSTKNIHNYRKYISTESLQIISFRQNIPPWKKLGFLPSINQVCDPIVFNNFRKKTCA